MKTQDLRDIVGPISLPGDWWWLWIIIGAVFLIALIKVLMTFRSRSVLNQAVNLPVLPWDKALKALSDLEKFSPEGPEQVKHFYFLLSGIVRLYIEERFSIRAPEMTTEEFMSHARGSTELSDQDKKFLNDFLNVCDMVKFARFEPLTRERVEAVRLARSFIEATLPSIQIIATESRKGKSL